MHILELKYNGIRKKYQLQKIIGRGTKCIVYRALCLNDQQQYVIKELYPQRLENEELIIKNTNGKVHVKLRGLLYWHKTIKTFRNGVRLFYNYIQSNPQYMDEYANYYNVISAKGTFYAVANDSNGKEWKPSLTASFKELLCDFIQICECVGHFHRSCNCILVMDIKQENFIKNDLRIQLVDFDGLIPVDKTSSRRLIFSSYTAPPEVIKHEFEKITPASDVYAVAAMIYTLIVSLKPCPNINFNKMLLRDALRRYSINIKTQIEFVELLCNALNTEYSIRPKDCIELSNKLQHIYDNASL